MTTDLIVHKPGTVAIPDENLAPMVPRAVRAYLADCVVVRDQRATWEKAEETARFRRSDDPDPREKLYVGRIPTLPVLDEVGRMIAEDALQDCQRALAPVTRDVLFMWLSPLAQVVRNPIPPAMLAENVRALFALLDDLPVGAFTTETRKRIEGDWFPSAGEIRRAVEPEAARLRDLASVLHEVSKPPATPKQREPLPEPPDDRPPPPDLSTLVASLRSPVGDDEPRPERIAADRPSVKPYFLRGEALAAARRAAASAKTSPDRDGA
jgi:hypothetical protein